MRQDFLFKKSCSFVLSRYRFAIDKMGNLNLPAKENCIFLLSYGESAKQMRMTCMHLARQKVLIFQQKMQYCFQLLQVCKRDMHDLQLTIKTSLNFRFLPFQPIDFSWRQQFFNENFVQVLQVQIRNRINLQRQH